MAWGLYFTIVAQVLGAVVILFFVTAVAKAIIDGWNRGK